MRLVVDDATTSCRHAMDAVYESWGLSTSIGFAEVAMGPVYATRLTIMPDEHYGAVELHHRSVDICYHWMRQLASKNALEIPDDPTVDGRWAGAGRRVSMSSEHGFTDHERAWRGVLVHPYATNGVVVPNMRVRAEIQARDADGEEVVTVRLLIGSLVDDPHPHAFYLKAPRVVRELIATFGEVSIGNKRARLQASYLAEDEVPGLVDDILRNDRGVPFVVISRTEDERVLCDPERIAREIVGLGRVYTLPSHAAGFTFTDRLGTSRLSCYNGAVRVYWPGIGVAANPYDHSLWLAERLVTDGLSGRLPTRIFRILAAASSLGISSDTRAWDIHRSADEARTQAVIDRAQAIVENKLAASEEDYLAAVEQVYQLKDEVAELNARIQQQQDKNADELFQAKAERDSLQEIIYRHGRDNAADRIALAKSVWKAKTVLDIVQVIERIADPSYLVFLDEAHDSAAKSHFNNDLDIVWHNLLLVHDGARQFHEDPAAKLQETMLEVGATLSQFKTDVSDTVRKMPAYQRRYVRDGEEMIVTLGPHVKNGKGNAAKSLCIYWHVDIERRKFVVGHIGRKLPDSTGGYP